MTLSESSNAQTHDPDGASRVENAQEKPRPVSAWQLGVKFSLGRTSLDYIAPDAIAIDRRGWAGGLFANTDRLPLVPRVPWLSFQGELLIVAKGADARLDVAMAPIGEFNLMYLEIPVLMRPYYSWKHVEVYGVAGLGLGFKLKADDEDGEENQAADSFDLGGIVGLGMTWYARNNVAVTLDIRYEHGFDGAYSLVVDPSSGVEQARANRAYLVSLGIGLSRNNRDGDHLRDEKDRCPNEAEDLDGIEDSDGCPEEDPDSDGVLDAADSCPMEHGPSGPDGCPDKDGDDVSDNKDQCPDVKGLSEQDGCPDGDKDGVRDELDKCNEGPPPPPLGVKNDGCPIYGYIAEVTTREIVLHNPIQFDTNQQDLTSLHREKLDELIILLRDREYKDLRIVVRGHADSKVKNADNDEDRQKIARNNDELSRKRAESVYRYLADKVEGKRFTTVGCGAKLAGSKSASWDDRAVDFLIFKKDETIPEDLCKATDDLR